MSLNYLREDLAVAKLSPLPGSSSQNHPSSHLSKKGTVKVTIPFAFPQEGAPGISVHKCIVR